MSSTETIDVDAKTVDPSTPPEPVLVSDVIRSDRLLLAQNTLKNHVIAATGVGLLPVPLLDLAAVMGIQVDMMRSLCKIYDVPFKEKLVRSLLSALATGAGAMIVMTGLSSLAKAVPVLGSVAGAAGMSATAAAVTYATGKVFIQHFEVGGTLKDFDPVKFKEAFRAKVREGAEVVKSYKSAATA